MAFVIQREKMENDEGGHKQETKFIEAGINPARLVSYVEMGMHKPMFKGKVAEYDGGKRSGEAKDDEFIIHLAFEFPQSEYDNYPLVIKTSIPYGTGEFINKLAVSQSMLDGNLSMAYANRSNFMKYLNAMNDALETEHNSLASFVGEGFLVAVTNKPGTKALDNGDMPMYANMKPDGIQGLSFKNPATGKTEDIKVPDAIGTYCPVFSWDAPDVEAWKLIPEYIQTAMKGAVDYPGSAVEAMVLDLPIAPDDTLKDNDKPATPQV